MKDTPRSVSVIIPVYNERRYLLEIVRRVEAVELPGGLRRQIVLVDDGSTDGTRDLLQELGATRSDVKVILQDKNRGKGAALRVGFGAADGDLVLVQDADFEYDPGDYPALLRPILDGAADVVYGSRFTDPRKHRGWHRRMNRILTILSNFTTGLRLTDMECCYKVIPRELLARITLHEDRFGFEPEITAKLARIPGVRIAEVPVSYAGRSYEQGKKINWKDGVSAIRCIIKYGLGVRQSSMLAATILLTAIAMNTCIQIEILNQRAGPVLPRWKYSPLEVGTKWRGWVDEREMIRHYRAGEQDEYLSRFTPEEWKQQERRGKANNSLHDWVQSWGLLQYLIVPLAILLSLSLALGRSARSVRVMASACTVIALFCGGLMIYRGYFASLGW